MLQTLESTGEEDLDSLRPYYGGNSLTAYEIFTVIAEHDLYHAGQIQLLKKLLRS